MLRFCATSWALRFAFQHANMHRVEIGAFGHNTGALRLYEKLGFTVDSRKRDYFWHEGKYWDLVDMAMLEDEWREKYADA
jgi:RimJ/RimL family protein N-acetyltransferase